MSHPAYRYSVTKLLIGVVLALAAVAGLLALAVPASAGGDTAVTVNSVSNTDDGDCEGAPNAGSGNCTLREAINEVNNGDADIIKFHPAVFAKAQPGIIDMCEGHGDGTLPFIERDVVIDSTDSGVILDGGSKDDECTGSAGWGITVEPTINGIDFTLLGGKNFEIRNICTLAPNTGVFINGAPDLVSFGTIEISGIKVENVCGYGVAISGSGLESASVTNSEISSSFASGVFVEIIGCYAGPDCPLDDSILNISGNRIEGGVEFDQVPGTSGQGEAATNIAGDGVEVLYVGVLSSKITVGVTENEVINGNDDAVDISFFGCGTDSGFNAHVDGNEEMNSNYGDTVLVEIDAGDCFELPPGAATLVVDATSDNFDATVTVNGNGDIENQFNNQDGVYVAIYVCCEESDSSATVEVNDNGRITGEFDGVFVETNVCCGDDNLSDVTANSNDEITGEGDDGIDVNSIAGSAAFSFAGAVAGNTGFDADDNVCTITVDGNNEIDGVGSGGSGGIAGPGTPIGHGIEAECFAGTNDTLGGMTQIDPPSMMDAGVSPSSGDRNTSIIHITNNLDVQGDWDGVHLNAFAGSELGEGDENIAEGVVSGNREVTGDTSDGIDAKVHAGSIHEEGDDNETHLTVEENAEVGGDGGSGLRLGSLSGGDTEGSERNSTAVEVTQNGSLEGNGSEGAGIDVWSVVCCDPANTNLIDIHDNKDEITGHDGSGIRILTCCSTNTVSILDNADNIRGGDEHGLDLEICGADQKGILKGFGGPGGNAAGFIDDYVDCLKHSVTDLTVMNNSFSDSEQDGIHIRGGEFEDEDLNIKSVISNNVVQGNGDDGIAIESASGLNLGPANEIFENGTEIGDNGIEIDWCLSYDLPWLEFDNKLPPNHNHITQNSIYDNFGLGIDLKGLDEDDLCLQDENSTPGCVPFEETAINPNDCLSFPDLKTQNENKLVGMACSLCEVEVFWADDTPDNNQHHGEGREYLVTTQADEDGNFSVELPCDLDEGLLTATATDKLKNTSEFSLNLSTLGTFCPTDTPTSTNTPVPPTNTPVPPTATNTPIVPPPITPTKICGDVNMDGTTNSIDATLVLQLKANLISSVPNESSADVNNDGAITSIDAALILQYSAALIGADDLDCPI